MNSREISLWMDERWIKALEERSGGKSIEEMMQAHLDKLIQTLPDKVREPIAAEIKAEDETATAQNEASRRFSVTRLTEGGQTHIYLRENGESLYDVAHRLRRYIRGEMFRPGKLYQDAPLLTNEQMEQIVAEAVSGSARVVGVHDIDLDKGELSTLDIGFGWRTFQVKDISTAIYHAAKRQSASLTAKQEKFFDLIDGMDCNPTIRPVYIRGTKPLPLEAVTFESDIKEIAGCFLSFYIPGCFFNPDSVFGTNVEADENDNWLRIYASYDIDRGCVCESLSVTLVRDNDTELSCRYRLTADEQAALLPMMDAYCKEQIDMELDKLRVEILAEQAPPPRVRPLRGGLEQTM